MQVRDTEMVPSERMGVPVLAVSALQSDLNTEGFWGRTLAWSWNQDYLGDRQVRTGSL